MDKLQVCLLLLSLGSVDADKSSVGITADSHSKSSAPEITVYSLYEHGSVIELYEGLAPGSAVALIEVKDADPGDDVIACYLEPSRPFMLRMFDDFEYMVGVADVLDRETTSSYDIIITCVDSDDLTASATLKVKVKDVNDNAPVFSRSVEFVDIEENNQVSRNSSTTNTTLDCN